MREREAFAQDVIGKRIDGSSLSPEDRSFATLLALGVVSSVGTLDDVLDRALSKPTDVQPDVRDALRLSVYEIIFLNKTPHAAVDQGVELVRSFAPRAAGLANAVLRKVVASRASFPFGDPTRDVEALARLHAFPVWLARKLVLDLGPQAALDFMRASNEPAPLFVAANAAKTDEAAVAAAFAKAGESTQPVEIDGVPVPGCLRVKDNRALLLPEVKQLFVQGKILVSDAASQLVAASVRPQDKPASMLEVGAGRATKTILLQSAAQRTWGSQIESYVTLDNHGFKTKLLLERAARYGSCVSEALTGDAVALGNVVRDRLFAKTQLGMLRAAAGHVAPGGTLAYATCTVTCEEDNQTVKAFLASEEGQRFQLAPIAGRSCLATRLEPGSSDAHFAVRFARVS